MFRRLPGKVHGSLARAGKVRGQTPKVAKQDKKKKPRGRAHKRMQYNRRFVTAVNYNSFGLMIEAIMQFDPDLKLKLTERLSSSREADSTTGIAYLLDTSLDLKTLAFHPLLLCEVFLSPFHFNFDSGLHRSTVTPLLCFLPTLPPHPPHVFSHHHLLPQIYWMFPQIPFFSAGILAPLSHRLHHRRIRCRHCQ
ncbi:hypothetical protein TEA_021144 [Camellia sinensis var. sinensis]|uniref:Uncharacterized protein n=1 Tax=Camellia sinensis var. sinensis TaxID=542762 RepID=A0A4S4DFB4_CAMSN|nr:hypothetical protein TEA_021144 [Camellia sinensis var. sinensis]